MQICALFDIVRDRYADLAAESGRFIALEAPSCTSVQADPDRLRQVLSNLLDNAIRHGEGEIALRAAELSDGVDITISDEVEVPRQLYGQGLRTISRADPTRGDTGAGLGLALVQAIAVAHGGRVWISCKAGTTVHLWLPNPHSRLISAS